MDFINVVRENGIAIVTLNRGKVNALNEILVGQLHDRFEDLRNNTEVKAIVLTGRGKFFSFGFDIPEFTSYSKEEFTRYLTRFTDLYTLLFGYPKPIIAALNGHTIAGGCMLATACDYRIMVSGKAKISLNEITFGSSVFAGSVEILKSCVGQRNAELILNSGDMYSAEDALQLGLIDRIAAKDDLMDDAKKAADDYAKNNNSAYSSIKKLLRMPIIEAMTKRERESIDEFIDIWYSDEMRERLKEIKIRS